MEKQVELQRQLTDLDLDVSVSTVSQLVLLLEQMLHWNRTYNLTAITDPGEAIEKHLVDSLTLLPHIQEATSILDIGSGAGFPSLPLKLARPDLNVVSVDSVAKKISFQKHMIRKLKLKQFTAWHGRAEDLPQQGFSVAGFDLVVARAFSSIPKLVELALPCLHPNGRIIAMKGPEGDSELTAASGWLKKNQVSCRELVRLSLPVSGSVRQLLILGR